MESSSSVVAWPAPLIARKGVGSVGASAIQRAGEEVKTREGILDGSHIKSFADAAGFLNDRAGKVSRSAR